MDSWIVDAKDLDISAIETFHESLFHRTGLLNEFLYLSKHATLVIAPKGYGKTLILKEKKRSLAADFDVHPKNVMLDKPTGVPNFRVTEYSDLIKTDSYWKTLWLLAIGFILIRINDDKDLNSKAFRRIERLVIDKVKKTPCELLSGFLLLSRSDFHLLENFYHSDVAARIRDVHRQTAFFIDNIEEFFEQKLYDSENDADRVMYRELWGASQVGLALAARDISSINPHIKIFASIRKEAVPRLIRSHGVGLQVMGASIEIKYDYEDLFDILIKNIRNDSTVTAAKKTNEDCLKAFFGQDYKSFFHPKTGDQESAAEYLLRHTLRRPRDIAHIGRAIRDTPVELRRTKRLKEIIARSASDIVEAYFAEMKPHIEHFLPEVLFPLIKSNTLSRKQIKNIGEKYDELVISGLETSLDVFSNMYKLGLLGWVATDIEEGVERQYFVEIGEVPLSARNCLPDSQTYLVHPILDDIISRYNRNYLRSLNGLNVIGPRKYWRVKRPYQFVLKGDVKGFSTIMSNPDRYSAFVGNFVATVKELCHEIDARFEGGDSMLLISDNPRHLLDIAQRIDKFTKSEYSLPMRFGCDVGFVEFIGASGQLKGNVLRRAARLEQSVKVDGIFITEEYIEESKKMGLRIENVLKCSQADLPHLSYDGDRFNLAKGNTDEDTFASIYKIYIL